MKAPIKRRTREAGQHGIRNNGKLAKFMESQAAARYKARKENPDPAVEVDMSWMKGVPTGLENL